MAGQIIVAAKSIIFFLMVSNVIINVTFASDVPLCVGMFSSLTYNKEGGDLLGYEIRVVPTADGLMGAIQVAEGDAGHLHVVPVSVSENKIMFDVPLTGLAVKFIGSCEKGGLSGVLNLPSGSESVFLKRGLSYWEKNKK